MISIVIPTLNSKKYLGKTLESIVNQSYKDWEVIIVDSYSIDGTLDIIYDFIKLYPDKIRQLNMPQRGQVRAINYGMSLAKGDVITFINSDDTYAEGCFDAIEYLFRLFKHEPFWLYGIGKVIDSDGNDTRSIVTWFKSLWWKGSSKKVFTWFDYISQPTVFFNRKMYELVGEFDPKYPLCFDYDYFLRCWSIENPVFIKRHLANWRVHSDSLSVKNTNKQIDESLSINKKYRRSFIDTIVQNSIAFAVKIAYGVIK